MTKIINLKKDPYSSAKISVANGKLYGKDKIQELTKMNFDEILRYLEENGFRTSVDKSYLQYNGFYLVERVLNDHLSNIYKSVFTGTCKQNRKLLESYYLKYQIHNVLVILRCKISDEKEFEPYLIGDSSKKAKYIKAYDMPNIEDALVYLVKKLKLDSKVALEEYSKGLYALENYLYKTYYSKLNELNFKFNGSDERHFSSFVRNYIDLLNARTYIRLKAEDVKIDFKENFMIGGKLLISSFTDLDSKSVEETLKEFEKIFGSIEGIESLTIESIDKRISKHKKNTQEEFKLIQFGSPFFALKYLFRVEREIGQLRILLKAKYLDLDQEELMRLL